MIRFGTQTVFSILFTAFLSPAWAQQLSLADLQSKLVGTWTVTFEQAGGKPRTFVVTTVSAKGDNAFAIAGTWNFTGEKEFPISDGEAVAAAEEVQVKFKTVSGALINATLKADSSFAGIFKFKDQDYPFRLAKGAAVAAAGTPQNRTYADEAKDWGVAPSAAPQGPPYLKPTPMTIPGGRVIRTHDVKTLLENNKQALAVDVLDRKQWASIPTAHWLPGAGNNPVDKGRFSAALDKLTGGDKSRPVVFLCYNSQCWESYNASLYAIEAGYKDVLWYRGGRISWIASKLDGKVPEDRINW